MHAASAVGSLECVQLLLGQGAGVHDQLHIKGKHTLTSLAEAHSKAPLYLAAENGHAAVVKVLLAAKADPNAPATTVTDQATTRTSALWAARRGKHTEVVELLESIGAKDEADMQEQPAEGNGLLV